MVLLYTDEEIKPLAESLGMTFEALKEIGSVKIVQQVTEDAVLLLLM